MYPINEAITKIGVVPVVKLSRPDQEAAPLAHALCAGGIPAAEIAFQAFGAEIAIRLMKEAEPSMIVGAGTVTSTVHIAATIAAGGQFVVTPGLERDLASYAQSKGIMIYPGCSTATDYHVALKHGLEILKFFPAESFGGVAAIQALSEPFPMFKVIPSGGITLDNLKEYLSCPVVAACSLPIPSDLIENQKWDEITDLCKKASEIVKEARA